MLEKAESDWWLPRSGHWIIMEEPDIMAEDSRLHQVKILSGCNLQTLADVKWTNMEPGEIS